jgi:hypothetical protein
MENESVGYSLFEDVREPLRSFNRCSVLATLMATSHEQAREYLNQLDEVGRAACVAMALSIKRDGVDAVKKKIVSEYKFEEDE